MTHDHFSTVRLGGSLALLAFLTGTAFWLGARTHDGAKTARTAEPADAPTRADAAQAPLITVVSRAAPVATPEPGAPAPARALPRPPVEPPHLTARSERDGQVEALRASGPPSGEQLTAIRKVEAEWLQATKAQAVQIDFSAWQCFHAGCYSTASYRDAGTGDRFLEKLTETKSFAAWPGGKFRSAPIDDGNGTFEISWVFFSPEAEAQNEPPHRE
jgi:hypothetical protein